jgi:uncharacterized protein (DUF983 family)
MVMNVDQLRRAAGAESAGAGKIRWFSSLLRGFRRSCPCCGEGKLFAGYVTMQRSCNRYGLEFEPYRADDAPAYFTILAVGHMIVPSMLILERSLHPETWVHMALWVPLTLGLSLGLLPRIKGAVIGVQWALDVRN